MANVIARIEVDVETEDVTFFFRGKEEPFSSSEFILHAKKRLRAIEEAIDAFNELGKDNGD